MKIEILAPNTPEEWLRIVSQQLDVEIVNDSIALPPAIGDGFFKQYYPFPGLTLSYLHYRMNQPITFIRKAVEHSPLIPIKFYSWGFTNEQVMEEQRVKVGKNTPNGIFMPSPQIPFVMNVPANTIITDMALTFDRKWLLSTLCCDEDSYLYHLLNSDSPFYLFETLSPAMMRLLQAVQTTINTSGELEKLQLHQYSMELLLLFLEAVNNRTFKKDIHQLRESDVEKAFHVRERILSNLAGKNTLSELALQAGMSESKLKKTFRQVFGKSISHFSLFEKMEYARQLLDSHKYSVGEVGYRVGYSNLSHFSKAFHKHFGINPRNYLSSKRPVQAS